MKLKNRLIVSFCIIIFVPIILTAIMFVMITKVQEKDIAEAYSVDENTYPFSNSLALISHYTEKEYNILKLWVTNDFSKFSDEQALDQINTSLVKKYSFLVIRRGEEITYDGDATGKVVDVKNLPSFGAAAENDNQVIVYTQGKKQLVLRQLDFVFLDGTSGSAFFITQSDGLLPEMKKLLVDFIVSMVLILIFTAAILITWTYSGLFPRMKQLGIAVENIKEGNLDFKIETKGSDEISELCDAFEEMRQRLQVDAQEKIIAENDQKQLISNIAHDLKTPLTAIQGYAEGIIDGVADNPEKQQAYLKTIYNKANEMNTLLNELTLYSKIDTNRIPYDFAHIHVTQYFMDCVEELGMDLKNQGVQLFFYNFVDEKAEMIADPEQLGRVIHNIVGNSLKYSGKEPLEIRIKVKDIGDFIQIEIEDNGRGISKEDLPHVFDRLYRADVSRNSSIGGSGIGLSIVKKIINDHGGQIWATSKVDVGTVMYFVLRKYQEVKDE